jgi:hypothetical protein
MADSTYTPLTYRTTGGDKMVVASGGELDIESGGSLKLAGTAITVTAAEINALASTGLDATELGYLNGVTAGTVLAGKAVVTTTDKHIDALVITDGGLSLGAGAGTAITATAAEINAAADLSVGAAVAANASTLAVTAAAHAGRVVQFGKLDGTIATLPAATGTGHIYRFVIGITATSNANIIKVANGTDVMDGSVNIQQDTDADGDSKVWRADVGDDTMTFAGAATTGGIKGGYIECVDYAAGFWSCRAYTQSGGGAEATPFSATV